MNYQQKSAKGEMKETNVSTKKCYMCENTDMLNEIDRVSKKYGLKWYKTPVGVLIWNGAEYFLLKFKKNSIRKIYHQNHDKTGIQKGIDVRFHEMDGDYVARNFHAQEWEIASIEETLRHIYHHGNKRNRLDIQRRQILSMITSTCVG